MYTDYFQPDHFRANALLLVVVSTLLQGVALLGVLPIGEGTPGRIFFGTAEMALIALLLLNGWWIRRWAVRSGQDAFVVSIATLCLLSLLICAGGDFINRNYFGIYHGHGSAIRHTYLADSVWFFAPGYALFAWATIRVARHNSRVSKRFITVCAVLAGLAGALGFADLYSPQAGAYVSILTGGYAVLIAIVGVSSVWLVKALGWRVAWPVAIGAVLATIADALIGHYWLYRDGYYPAISHVNWILYFASQALVQQLPLQLVGTRP